jgi:hypothetical protein
MKTTQKIKGAPWKLPFCALIAMGFTGVVACGGATTVAPDAGIARDPASTLDSKLPPGNVSGPFGLRPVPELQAESTDGKNRPLYFFLFAHTEDQFNDTLSEERYTRLTPEVAKVGAANPQAHVVWNVMFQGADALRLAERSPKTGIVEFMKGYAQQGYVEFGYHAHHDPTYYSRPQKTFSTTSSWEEMVQGMVEWSSCERDPLYGGCVADEGGGVMAIIENFGPVGAVSGFFNFDNCSIEGGPGRHAISRRLPDRMVGFSFPNHGGSIKDKSFTTNRDALIRTLSPSHDTSGTVIWIDDVIKMNDGDPVTDIDTIKLSDGVATATKKISKVNRKKSHIINSGLGDKYIYTPMGSSPTVWAYANPNSPELPQVNSRAVIEDRYTQSGATLSYLAGDFVSANPGSRFVGAQEIVELVAPAAYWQISAEKLDVLARWAVLKWKGSPPPFVSDGDDFYSLRDLFVLLSKSLAGKELPSTLTLTLAYGPTQESADSPALSISAEAIRQLAQINATSLAPPVSWTATPTNMLASDYVSNGQALSAAQLLYAMAMLYASEFAGKPLKIIEIPATQSMPQTLENLKALHCLHCAGTAWSLKPARIGSL